MKNISFILFISLIVFSSCHRDFEKAIKETDPEVIIPVAKKYFEKEKFEYAKRLFEHASKFTYGTDYAKEVAYYNALSNYGFKNYPLAARQFKSYAQSYRTDSLAEHSQYMSAKCFYEGSLDYNLDQKNTHNAIKELQNFINLYPKSEKLSECNTLIDELHQRLERKAYENARTLFKIGKYRSSSIAFDNVLGDFPDTNYKEKILWHAFQSKAFYAFESFNEFKKDRLNDAMTAYKIFKNNFPNSKFLKDADKIASKINDEKTFIKNLKNNLANKNL